MTVIPNFLLKRVFVKNSLRHVENGAAFDLHNIIGPGSIIRINSFGIDEAQYPASSITLTIEGRSIQADSIDEENPTFFPMNQKITCTLKNASLTPGKHTITVDLVSLEGGQIQLSVTENVTEEQATPGNA